MLPTFADPKTDFVFKRIFGAYFFREAKNLDVVPPALSVGPFRDALEVARTATFDPAAWEAYERAKMAEQDARGALVVAQAESKANAILSVLTARGLVVDETIRARLLQCSDLPTLERWLVRAVTASRAEDVFVELESE